MTDSQSFGPPRILHSASNSSRSIREPSFIVNMGHGDVSPAPISPFQSTRYNAIKRPMHEPKSFTSGRHSNKDDLNMQMLKLSSLKSGWQEYIHPDGKPYYRYPAWNVVTEVDVRDSEMLEALERLHGHIDQMSSKNPVDKGQFELYLDIQPQKSHANYTGFYYFVEHKTLDLFWLEEVELDNIINNVAPKAMRYGDFILLNYYKHLEHFPCHNTLPEDAIDTLRGELAFICTDHMTSGASSWCPWNSRDAKDFLDLLQSLEGLDQDNRNQAPTAGTVALQVRRTWFVSRLLSEIYLSRTITNHGLINARTDRSFGRGPTNTTIKEYLAGVLTFFSYLPKLERLEFVWVDRIVSTSGWQSFVLSLLSEYSDSNLLATVLLSANMALLAIQIPTSAITTSVISTLFSIGSIVLGLHHVWKLRDKVEDTATSAARYFNNMGSIRGLSILLSLPLTFLSWSLVFFAVSILIYAFNKAKVYAFSIVLVIVVGAVCVTVRFFWKMFQA